MDPVIVEIGPLAIRWYGLMYVVAIVVGIVLVTREIRQRGLNLTLDDVLDFVLITVPLAIIGARLYYVAFQWQYYGQNLGDIYKIWQGGLAIHGGLIAGVLGLLIFAKWKKVSFWTFADVVVPALALGQAFGRFGNFMNGDAYGIPTNSIFGIVFPSNSPAGQAYPEMHLHPTMLYELVGCLLLFGVLWWLKRQPFKAGFLTSVYAIGYSVLRFIVEFYRGDALCLTAGTDCVTGAQTFLESLKVAQVISVLILLIFATLMIYKEFYKRSDTESAKA